MLISTPTDITSAASNGVNYLQALITAAFAVLSGFILYVIKTFIDEKWLRQYREYRKLRAEISYNLVMYANCYMNPQSQRNNYHDEAGTALRKCAALLRSFIEEWPRKYIGIPNNKKLMEISSELIGLSNRVYKSSLVSMNLVDHNEKSRKKIVELLKLKNLY